MRHRIQGFAHSFAALTMATLTIVTLVACKKRVASDGQPDAGGPAAALAPALKVEDFSGEYVSSYGAPVTFTQTAALVESSSKRHGKITCAASGVTLDCSWVNGNASGKEKLVKQPDGTLSGTYGDGESSTGGVISFKKKAVVVAASQTAGAVTVAPTSAAPKPACPHPEQTKCPSGNCENLQVSSGNCGRCGNFCPTGTVCQKGVCAK